MPEILVPHIDQTLKIIVIDFNMHFSPTLVSQEIGGKNKNLFTVHSLDAGAFTNTNIKVSIENIRKSKIDDDYGKFDLVVRKYSDTDESAALIETGESFRGLSIDPTSNDYVGRRIGTVNKYYDFDKYAASQKIVVDGVHPQKSRYIRVSMNAEVDAGETTKTALPVGFRGPYHLVTSGSDIFNPFLHPATADHFGSGALAIYNPAKGLCGSSSVKLVEPPIPYRFSIADGRW